MAFILALFIYLLLTTPVDIACISHCLTDIYKVIACLAILRGSFVFCGMYQCTSSHSIRMCAFILACYIWILRERKVVGTSSWPCCTRSIQNFLIYLTVSKLFRDLYLYHKHFIDDTISIEAPVPVLALLSLWYANSFGFGLIFHSNWLHLVFVCVAIYLQLRLLQLSKSYAYIFHALLVQSTVLLLCVCSKNI